jgi:hypothetical protein
MLKGIDFVTSNVPGPRREVFSAGAKMDEVYGFGPLSGAAINVTLFSYAGTCFVAINSDPHAPILKMANVAIVGDVRTVVPAVIKDLSPTESARCPAGGPCRERCRPVAVLMRRRRVAFTEASMCSTDRRRWR